MAAARELSRCLSVFEQCGTPVVVGDGDSFDWDCMHVSKYTSYTFTCTYILMFFVKVFLLIHPSFFSPWLVFYILINDSSGSLAAVESSDDELSLEREVSFGSQRGLRSGRSYTNVS